MAQSSEDKQFIIDMGLATGIQVQYIREWGENPVWTDRAIGRKHAPPAPDYSYRLKPTDPDEDVRKT